MTSERAQPRLEGRVAIVSGGARGIGAAHVRALIDEGAHVVIGDVLADEGTSLAQHLGHRARFIKLDVTSEADWAAAVATAEQDGWSPGPVTILVNNAGIMDPSPIGELSAEAGGARSTLTSRATFSGSGRWLIRCAGPAEA